MKSKKTVAVFFGGRSPEHDVSVVSGLQALQAVDTSQFDAFPVYVSPSGQWYTGDALRSRANYLFTEQTLKGLTAVHLDLSASGQGLLVPVKKGFFDSAKGQPFDIALPIFHGLHGEDGGFQGLMEFTNVAYAGMRAKACAIFMDKDSTKHALAGLGVPMLPWVKIDRPKSGLMVPAEELQTKLASMPFPCCAKPANLGSSIGVGKITSIDEARAVLANIFKYDTKAIIEPFVQNLVEYNVAVRRNPKGETETSAIERPKTSQELLDFKAKYLSGGGSKKTGGVKAPAQSEGMLSLTRDINPDLPPEQTANIRSWATKVFDCFDGAGAPRIDFISDKQTGQVWFNELNPIPGSYGYFLWELSDKKILFTEHLTDLLNQGFELHQRKQIPHDPVPADARLLKRAM